MTDTLSTEERSACMRSVRGKNTTPELVVRSLVHSMGFRYVLHSKTLPGKPDLVLVRRRKIIFVHGCFWHRHRCRHGQAMPVANSDYWEAKLEKNARRDRQQLKDLRQDGWEVLVIWECWTRNLTSLQKRLERFLRTRA